MESPSDECRRWKNWGTKNAEWGCVWGCPLPTRLGGLASVVSSPSGVRDWSPVWNAFWSIFKATVRSLLHLYADALSSSNSVSWHIGKGQDRRLGQGQLPPVSRSNRPCTPWIEHCIRDGVGYTESISITRRSQSNQIKFKSNQTLFVVTEYKRTNYRLQIG